jgi:hypothetical protein
MSVETSVTRLTVRLSSTRHSGRSFHNTTVVNVRGHGYPIRNSYDLRMDCDAR